MNREDVIRMATEAGLYSVDPRTPSTGRMIMMAGLVESRLERFADRLLREQHAEIERLKAALTYDWDQLEACRGSLREHMAEIKRLRGGVASGERNAKQGVSHTLTIYRGPSGSGKTTAAAAASQKKGIPHFEADQFFMNDGVYRFNPSRLQAAHAWCFESTMNALKEGSAIVSNTFTRFWEIEKYIVTALNELQVDEVVIIEMDGRFSNVHGLTEAQVETQRQRFQSNIELYLHLKNTTNFECDSGWPNLRVQRFLPPDIQR